MHPNLMTKVGQVGSRVSKDHLGEMGLSASDYFFFAFLLLRLVDMGFIPSSLHPFVLEQEGETDSELPFQ